MASPTETVNIGMQERRIRRTLGVVMLAVTVIISMVFIWYSINPVWGLVLLLLYYQGVRFILDYRTGTCPLKAELGQSKLDARFFSVLGTEIEDAGLAAAIRSKSRKALYQAIGAAIVLTLLTMTLMALTQP